MKNQNYLNENKLLYSNMSNITQKRVNILIPLTNNYKTKLTQSELSRITKIPQQSLSRYLNSYVREGIIDYKIEGRNKLYYFNFDNILLVKEFILSLEHLKNIKFYKKHLLIKEVSEKILPLIEGCAIIFGSYAKNLQKKDSDLDIMIIGKCNEKEIAKFSEIYGIDINLKIYSTYQRDILMTEVIKNHIVIKNIELFIEMIFNEKNKLVY